MFSLLLIAHFCDSRNRVLLCSYFFHSQFQNQTSCRRARRSSGSGPALETWSGRGEKPKPEVGKIDPVLAGRGRVGEQEVDRRLQVQAAEMRTGHQHAADQREFYICRYFSISVHSYIYFIVNFDSEKKLFPAFVDLCWETGFNYFLVFFTHFI